MRCHPSSFSSQPSRCPLPPQPLPQISSTLCSSSLSSQDWVMDSRVSLHTSPGMNLQSNAFSDSGCDLMLESMTSQHDSPSKPFGLMSSRTSGGEEAMESCSLQHSSPEAFHRHRLGGMPSEHQSPGISSIASAPDSTASLHDSPGLPVQLDLPTSPQHEASAWQTPKRSPRQPNHADLLKASMHQASNLPSPQPDQRGRSMPVHCPTAHLAFQSDGIPASPSSGR